MCNFYDGRWAMSDDGEKFNKVAFKALTDCLNILCKNKKNYDLMCRVS